MEYLVFSTEFQRNVVERGRKKVCEVRGRWIAMCLGVVGCDGLKGGVGEWSGSRMVGVVRVRKS